MLAYCPVEISCRFGVPLDALCLGKFRASGDKVINCLLKLPIDSAHWVDAISLDAVSIVVDFNALILGSDNETFCF